MRPRKKQLLETLEGADRKGVRAKQRRHGVNADVRRLQRRHDAGAARNYLRILRDSQRFAREQGVVPVEGSFSVRWDRGWSLNAQYRLHGKCVGIIFESGHVCRCEGGGWREDPARTINTPKSLSKKALLS